MLKNGLPKFYDIALPSNTYQNSNIRVPAYVFSEI